MKSNSKIYIVIKLILIIALIHVFLNPEIFTSNGYSLSVDGVVLCRGISLVAAINMISTSIDTIYKECNCNKK